MEERNILILGDIHGEFELLRKSIDKKQISDVIIIQVGDFGIGFYDKHKDQHKLHTLNNFFIEKNIEMYVIRGNHDDPSYFNGDHNYSNLKLLKDYTELNINGFNFLFIGGAVSIDRQYRLAEQIQYGKRPSFWFDEKFNLDIDKVENIENIDVVITHTAPNICHPNNDNGYPPIVLNYTYVDNTLLEDLEEERNNMDMLLDRLKIKNNIKKWYYGHFHTRKTEIIDNIEFNLVDVFEFREFLSYKDLYN